ncbi:MAG: hypothetical protein MUP33_12350, partial [Polaromonas sp.]|nr:hypothetical protein [Polaromonas sp.]
MATQARAPAHLKLPGVDNPLSRDAVELYDVHGLSTQDRLFFCLWQNSNLPTRVFNPGDTIAKRGDRVHFAHVVLSGGH